MPSFKNPTTIEQPWYSQWFDSDYEKLYGHRDPSQAKTQVSALFPFISNKQGLYLDLGCGNGRHLQALKDLGLHVCGGDLSPHLLSQAQATGAPLTRLDMHCLPFVEKSFDGVFSFFSSFGYFEKPEDDWSTVEQIKKILKPNGLIFLDLPDKESVLSPLPNRDQIERQGTLFTQERSWDGDRVIKKITWTQENSTQVRYEKLRLYDNEIVDAKLVGLGFKIIAILGDEQGQQYRGPGLSPRRSILARLENNS